MVDIWGKWAQKMFSATCSKERQPQEGSLPDLRTLMKSKILGGGKQRLSEIWTGLKGEDADAGCCNLSTLTIQIWLWAWRLPQILNWIWSISVSVALSFPWQTVRHKWIFISGWKRKINYYHEVLRKASFTDFSQVCCSKHMKGKNFEENGTGHLWLTFCVVLLVFRGGYWQAWSFEFFSLFASFRFKTPGGWP